MCINVQNVQSVFQVTDIPSENLLSHLPSILAFISQVNYTSLSKFIKDDAIAQFSKLCLKLVECKSLQAPLPQGQSCGCVLVHCYYGRSRSATVITAFLMAKYRCDHRNTRNTLHNITLYIQTN